MARNDEGEFELVLGNRQLLSGFFIVVVLFGVFFTMGYIVGRHSSPAPLNTASAAAAEQTPAATPSPGAPPPGQAAVMPAETAKAETLPPPTPEPSATTPSTTAPVTTRPATAPPESPKAAAPPAPAPTPKPASERPAGAAIPEPSPGIYLQVAAPKRTAAGAVVESLKNKGIGAQLAPGPDADTVRVVVGPLEPASLGKMRADLESAGFKPFAKKY